MAFEYHVPPQTLTSLMAVELATPERAIARDHSGLELEIEFIEEFGWSLEVRYDRAAQGTRQPFTGIQEQLKRASLTLEITEGHWNVQAGRHSLRLSQSGALEFTVEGLVYLTTPHSPFARHATAIEIYDQLISLKVTDYSFRSSLHTTAPTYLTQMVRFSYPRPTGVVLGLPGQTGDLNRNGYRYDLYNTDTFTHTPARPPMYQSWPIVMHHAPHGKGWVGIFHDNPSRTHVDIGEFDVDTLSFESQCNNTRVYITYRPDLAELSRAFVMLLGDIPFPPLWSFGYQQCRWSYMSSQEIRDVVSRLHQEDFPCDAIYFDIDYMDGFRVFTRNRETFNDLAKCISALRTENVYSVCIVDPGVKIDDQYHSYKAISESGAYLRNSDGQPFVMKCWAGESLLPDFGSAEGKRTWTDLQDEWLKQFDFAGIWNDMNEPSNFDGQNASTSRAYTARGPITEEYNLYGYHMAETSALAWRTTHPDTRGIVITRSGYPGVQRHAVIWHGDNCAWWEHLRLAFDTALLYSLCGAFYTGADLPGFTGNPPDDLAVRFYQLGAFLPLFRGHSRYFERDKEPYAFGLEARNHIRHAINLRYSLLREWYSGFERAIAEHSTPLVPVFDSTGAYIRDEMLLFGKFLIAPIMERDQRRKLVYLPPGLWYSLGDTERPLRGDSWQVLPVDLSTTPVFVRGGSVIVRNQPHLTTSATLAARERFEVYLDEQGTAHGYRYSDDGISSRPTPTRERLAAVGREVAVTPW